MNKILNYLYMQAGALCNKKKSSFRKKVAVIILLTLIPQSVIYPSETKIIIDSQQESNDSYPILDGSLNGTPIIHVSSPSKYGTSLNIFKEYSVGDSNLIINNSTEKTHTQLAGTIGGNPNYENGKSSDIIIFDVSGTSPTYLNGMTEIAGTSADLILSNKQGIRINGAIFANTNRLSLSTGELDSFGDSAISQISRGPIFIEEKGVYVLDSGSVSLISDSIRLHGPVIASKNSHLTLITGKNNIDLTSDNLISTKENKRNKDVISLDSTELGGMYAGSIHIISTGKGESLSLTGDMIAYSNGITINAMGDIYYNNIVANDDVGIFSENNIVTNGNTVSEKEIRIRAGGDLVFQTTEKIDNDTKNESMMLGSSVDIKSEKSAVINAPIIANNGIRLSSEKVSVTNTSINSGKSLTIQGEKIGVTESWIESEGALVIKGGSAGKIETSVISGNVLSVEIAGMSEHRGTVYKGKEVEIVGGSMEMIEGVIESEGAVGVSVEGVLGVESSTIVGADVGLEAGGFEMRGGVVDSKTLQITVNEMEVVSSDIRSLEKIRLTSGYISINETSIHTNDLQITAKNMRNEGNYYDTSRIAIMSDDVKEMDASIDTNTIHYKVKNLDIKNTMIAAKSQFSISGDTLKLDNNVWFSDEINIKTQSLLSQSNSVHSNFLDIGYISLDFLDSEVIVNKELGLVGEKLYLDYSTHIYANENAFIDNKEIKNEARIFTKKGVVLAKEKLINQGSFIAENMMVSANSIQNSGTFSQGIRLNIHSDSVENSGEILGGSIDINTNNLTHSGNIKSNNSGNISTKYMTNNGHIDLSRLSINAIEFQNNADIYVEDDMSITVKKSKNSGHVYAGNISKIRGDLDNSGGILLSNNTLDLNFLTHLNNKDGEIYAHTSLLWRPSENVFTNEGLIVVTGEEGIITMGMDRIQNSGRLYSAGDMYLDAGDKGRLSGDIQSKLRIKIRGKNVVIDGQLKSEGLIQSDVEDTLILDDTGTLQSQNVYLHGDNITLLGSIKADSAEFHAGTIYHEGRISGSYVGFDASHYINIKNVLDVSDQLFLKSGKKMDIEKNGNINAREIILRSDGDIVNKGVVQSQKMQIFSHDLETHSHGQWLAKEDLLIKTQRMLRNNGSISANLLLIDYEEYDQNDKNNSTNVKHPNISRLDIINNGDLYSDTILKIRSNGMLQNGGTVTGSSIDIRASDMNQSGNITGHDDIVLNINKTLNNNGELIGGNTVIIANNLTNIGSIHADELVWIEANNSIKNNHNILSNNSVVSANFIDNFGHIKAKNKSTLSAREYIQNWGTIDAKETNTVHSEGHLNLGGTILSDNNIQMIGNDIIINGQISGNNAEILAKNALTNTGKIQAESDLHIESEGSITNEGSFNSKSRMYLKSQWIKNLGVIYTPETGKIGMFSETITNHTSPRKPKSTEFTGYISGGNITMIAKTDIKNESEAKISANKGLLIKGRSFDNKGILSSPITNIELTGNYRNSGYMIGKDLSVLAQSSIDELGNLSRITKTLDLHSLNGQVTMLNTHGITLDSLYITAEKGGEVKGKMSTNYASFVSSTSSIINKGSLRTKTLNISAKDTIDKNNLGDFIAYDASYIHSNKTLDMNNLSTNNEYLTTFINKKKSDNTLQKSPMLNDITFWDMFGNEVYLDLNQSVILNNHEFNQKVFHLSANFIEAKNVTFNNQTLFLGTKNDLTLTHVFAKVSNNIALTSQEGGIVINGWFDTDNNNQTYKGSSLMANTILSMHAKKDIQITGSHLYGKEGLEGVSEGRILIDSVLNRSFESTRREWTEGRWWWKSKKKEITTKETESLADAGVFSDKNIMLMSSKGIVTSGALIEGDGSVLLLSEEDIVMNSVLGKVGSTVHRYSNEIFSGSSRHYGSEVITAYGSSIRSNGKATLQTKNSIISKGGHINANEGIELKANGSVTFDYEKGVVTTSETVRSAGLVRKRQNSQNTSEQIIIKSLLETNKKIVVDTTGVIAMRGVDYVADSIEFINQDSVILSGAIKESFIERTEISHGSSVKIKNGVSISKESRTQTTREELTQILKSHMNVKNSITFRSKDSVILEGVEGTAANINITANNNLSVLSMQSVSKMTKELTELEGILTLKVNHIALEIAEAVNNAKHAIQLAEDMQAQADRGELSQASATLQKSKAAFALGHVAKMIAKAATHASTMGVTITAEVEGTETKQKESSLTSISESTTLKATNNLTLTSQNGDILLEGSHLKSDKDITLIASKDILIEAGKSTTDLSFTHKKNSTGIITNIYDPNNKYHDSQHVSQTNNHQNSHSTSFENATIFAGGTVTAATKTGSLLMNGGNLIGSIVDTSGIAGDIMVESLQNASYSNEKTQGIAGSNTSFNTNKSTSQGKRLWTDAPSSLIGTETLIIGGKTLKNKGGIIGNINENGEIGKELIILSKEVIAESLHDSDTWEASGFLFGMEFKPKNMNNSERNISLLSQLHTVSMGITGGKSREEQQTQGVILESNDKTTQTLLSETSINQDLSLLHVNTKSQKTPNYNYSVNINNDWISTIKEGTLIKKDHSGEVNDEITTLAELKESTIQAFDNIKKSGGNIVQSLGHTMAGNTSDSLLHEIEQRLRNQELGLQGKNNHVLRNALDEFDTRESLTTAELELESIGNVAMLAHGIYDSDLNVSFYNNDDGNMGAHKEGKIYINLAYQDGTMTTLMEVLGDELSHYTDYKEGRNRTKMQSNNTTSDVSRHHGDDAARQTRGYVGEQKSDMNAFYDRIRHLDFSQINEEVSSMTGMDNRVYSAARDLNGFPIGTHQFEILIPDNPHEFDDKKLKELGVEPMRDLGNHEKGWVIGGHKKEDVFGNHYLHAEFFEKSDTEATKEFLNPHTVKWYRADFDTEASLVTHEGKTDTEFITDVLKNTMSFQKNQSTMPISYPKNTEQYVNGTWNSNSWNNSNLKHSGGTKYQTDFVGMDPARDAIIPEKYFTDALDGNRYEANN
jgi:hypothetical protein